MNIVQWNLIHVTVHIIITLCMFLIISLQMCLDSSTSQHLLSLPAQQLRIHWFDFCLFELIESTRTATKRTLRWDCFVSQSFCCCSCFCCFYWQLCNLPLYMPRMHSMSYIKICVEVIKHILESTPMLAALQGCTWGIVCLSWMLTSIC